MSTVADRAAELVGVLVVRQRAVGRAQAALTAAMVEFAGLRRGLDAERIAGVEARGGDARYVAGEFAADEVGLALACSTWSVQRLAAMTRRVQARLPQVWEAWCAGDIDQEKVRRIDAGARRLRREDSWHLLDATVVDVAVCRTAELVGRWVNRLVARLEPAGHDARCRDAFSERYVSLRAGLDGMSSLSAALSSLDAAAVDAVLTALATSAGGADPRSMSQRRADALTDLLLGRISNAHTPPAAARSARAGGEARSDCAFPSPRDGDRRPAEMTRTAPTQDGDSCPNRPFGAAQQTAATRVDEPSNAPPGPAPTGVDLADDWDLPASAFRPDPRAGQDDPDAVTPTGHRWPVSTEPTGPSGPPPVARQHHLPAADTKPPADTTRPPTEPESGPRPVPVMIGVVVPVQSLLGLTDTPGELTDRSGTVPAEVIRELARQPDTLFWRLLTDERGTLLDATELGRFPSLRLGTALDLRAATCTRPTCTVPAARCDADHHTPHPAGATEAGNLDPTCRRHHRAKTHAGHGTRRSGDATQWTTPTGHTYTATDDPLPLGDWPAATTDVSWLERRITLLIDQLAA